MEPQGGRRRRISRVRCAKRSKKLRRLSKTTRSRVHVQTVGLNAETKTCRHRADGEECLLTFPFIGLLRQLRFWHVRCPVNERSHGGRWSLSRYSPRTSARIHSAPAISKVSAFSLQFV